MLNLHLPFRLDYLVLQPTSLCNLNCSYCYLPNRLINNIMSEKITKRLADDLCEIQQPLQIIWHGGEPTACGLQKFESLVKPLADPHSNKFATHCIQTNATLLDKDWCDFFVEYKFKVGVSIDGSYDHNAYRVSWDGKPAFNKIMKGISLLRQSNIPFSLIAVIGNNSLDHANEVYTFLASLGAEVLGVNIEETEGLNHSDVHDDVRVKRFWGDLLSAWKQNPIVSIREFNHMLPKMHTSCFSPSEPRSKLLIDIFPSISWDGNVVFLSPEFLGARSEKYNNFVAGNIMEKTLTEIISAGYSLKYVEHYLEGVDRCRNECEYYGFCGGGQASNKFFELGNVNGSETMYCRNTIKNLVDGIINSL